MKRAAALGLDYRTYAGVRAATGHDLVAFLFSSNALRASALRPAMPEARAAKLAAVDAGAGVWRWRRWSRGDGRGEPGAGGLLAGPLCAGALGRGAGVVAGRAGHGAAGPVLLVGDHALEAEWCAAGRLAGYLPADRYFG